MNKILRVSSLIVAIVIIAAGLFGVDSWIGLTARTAEAATLNVPSPYATIQAAVTAASANDTIQVAPGTYEEQVVITTQGLTIIGSGSGADPAASSIIRSPLTLTYYFTSSANNYPIVGVVGVIGVSLKNCRIDGYGRGNSNYRFVGIAFYNAGGSVSDCYIIGIQNTPFSGAQHGNGIYAYNATGGPYNIDIDGVTVVDFQKNGMTLVGSGLTTNLSNCAVLGHGPTTTTAQNGIQISGGANGTVLACSVSGIAYTGTGWIASGMLFIQAGTVDVGGMSSVTGSQACIVYQETQGSINGVDITTSGVIHEEGVSIRDYGYALTSSQPSGKMIPLPVAPMDKELAAPGSMQTSTGTNVSIANATLTGVNYAGSYGIAVWSLGAAGDNVTVPISNCRIRNWEYGVVSYDGGGGPSINVSSVSSRIYDNAAGFWTNALNTQNIEHNWWGAYCGPYHATLNPNGLGNEVADSVDFIPWCDSTFTKCDFTTDPPDTVWVDDGYSASGANDGHYWCYDAFAVIQDGIDAVSISGVVIVGGGNYVEQVEIGKSLKMVGVTNPVVQAPSGTLKTYTIPESGAIFEPIIMAYGGVNDGLGNITGMDTIAVTVTGFAIDGNNAGASNRFVAIMARNCRSSLISYNNIYEMLYRSGLPQTSGILLYGNSNAIIDHNIVNDWTRGGIVVNGDLGSLPKPAAVISNNTVVGEGVLPLGSWAQNGIQIGYGASGSIIGNDVSDISILDPDWSASGIILYQSAAGIVLQGNHVHNCQGALNTYYVSDLVINGNNVFDHNDFELVEGGNNARIEANAFTNNNQALYFADATNAQITNNTFNANGYGIIADGACVGLLFSQNHINGSTTCAATIEPYESISPSSVVFHSNDISSNIYGITNTTPNMINATGNWWGDASGPIEGTLLRASSVASRPAMSSPADQAKPNNNRAPFKQNIAGIKNNKLPANNSLTLATGNAVSPLVDYSPWWGANYVGNPHSSPWNWYVNTSNSSTIQEGITAATANDTVRALPLTFHEHVLLNKPLVLLGDQYNIDPTPAGARTNPANESVIDLVGVPVSNPNVLLEIALGISNVTVAGFTLNGSTTFHYADEAAIRCWTNNINIQNNIFNSYIGILYKGPGQYLNVSNNRMVVNKNGLIAQPGSLTNGTIVGNTFSLGSPGGGDESAIYLTGTSQVNITGNTATGFINGRGIAGSNLHNLGISGNTFAGNKDGISIWGGSTFINVTNNTLANSLRHGINIKGQDIVISGNDIKDNDSTGIAIDRNVINTERVAVNHNKIRLNTGYGLWVNTILVTETINAENNWWGGYCGPYHPTLNPAGQGDKVSNKVDFEPWCDSTFIICDFTTAAPNTVWVDDNYTPYGVNDGHFWCHDAFATIQAGVNAVAANGVVIVQSGTYGESVNIGKSVKVTGLPGDYAIPGPGSGAPILDGSSLLEMPAFSIGQGVSNVVIEGFEIRNYGPDGNTDADGVVAWNSGTTNITVRDNYMHHLGYAGVLIGNGWGGPQGLHRNWNVTGNIISNFGAYALDIENAENSQLARNVISQPTYSNTMGIVVLALADSGANITSSGITILGNKLINYPDRAIYLLAWTQNTTSSATLQDVTISQDTISTNFSAISVYQPGPGTNSIKNFTITDNIISVDNPKSAGYAIDLTGIQGASNFRNNILSLSGAIGGGGTFFHGINIGGVTTGKWDLVDNILDGNSVGLVSAGIRLRGSLPSTVILKATGNTITEFATGIMSDNLVSGAQIQVNLNSIAGNTIRGIANGNGAGEMIDAEANWWGNATGPATTTVLLGSLFNDVVAAPPSLPRISNRTDNILEIPQNLTLQPAMTELSANGEPVLMTLNSGLGDSVTSKVDYSPWWGANYVSDSHINPWRWYVDISNNSTIQEGVDWVTDGDAIYLTENVFSSPVNIDDRSNLSIIGLSQTGSVFKPASTFSWAIPGYPQYDSRKAALRIVNSLDITLTNLTVDLDLVKGNNICGLFYWNSTGEVSNNIITNNSVSDALGGYYELTSYFRAPNYSDTLRADILVKGNQFSKTGRIGVITHDYVHAVIDSNSFIQAPNDFGYAIELGSTSTGVITRNTIRNYRTFALSDSSSVSGIYVENAFTSGLGHVAKPVTIANNEIYDCQFGLWVGNEYPGYAGDVDITAIVSDNKIHDNTGGEPLVNGGAYIVDEGRSEGSSVTANFANNVFGQNGDVGIYFSTYGNGEIHAAVNGDTITGHNLGVIKQDNAAGTTQSSYDIAIHNSAIYGNAVCALSNDSVPVIHAENNWWGHMSGPHHVGPCPVTHLSNPLGMGDSVTNYIYYTPWILGICDYIPGDINGDGSVIGGDVTYGVRYFKLLGAPPPDSCLNDSTMTWLYSAGDVNGNCEFRGSDITYLVAYFKGTNPRLKWCPRTPPPHAGMILGKPATEKGSNFLENTRVIGAKMYE